MAAGLAACGASHEQSVAAPKALTLCEAAQDKAGTQGRAVRLKARYGTDFHHFSYFRHTDDSCLIALDGFGVRPEADASVAKFRDLVESNNPLALPIGPVGEPLDQPVEAHSGRYDVEVTAWITWGRIEGHMGTYADGKVDLERVWSVAEVPVKPPRVEDTARTRRK
jgi:hypothetical protein